MQISVRQHLKWLAGFFLLFIIAVILTFIAFRIGGVLVKRHATVLYGECVKLECAETGLLSRTWSGDFVIERYDGSRVVFDSDDFHIAVFD